MRAGQVGLGARKVGGTLQVSCYLASYTKQDRRLTHRSGSCKYDGLRSAVEIEEKTWDLPRTRYMWARNRILRQGRWSRRFIRRRHTFTRSLESRGGDTTTLGRIIRIGRHWSAR